VSEIVLEGVSKLFPGVAAVDDVSLTIEDGEFLVLVGPSGCGKSTLLRMIAGLEDVSAGRIRIGSRDVTHVPPKERDIAMVFQSYALYPHMTVRENLAFSLGFRRVGKAETRRRVDDVAQILGLRELLERKPAALSGGQRQRVAMGRAIVREPRAFLMDEPLSNLDAKLRVQMRTELARLHDRLRTTTVYVTHDQVEAMTLGHRVVVMRDGAVQQIGSPRELFARPRNVFVAGFIGSPAMNLVQARIDGASVVAGELRLPLAGGRPAGRTEVVLGIRPSSFDAAEGATGDHLLRLTVNPQVVEDLGTESLVVFPLRAAGVRPDLRRADVDDDLPTLSLDQGEDALIVARVGPGHHPVAHRPFDLVVDLRALHLFDLETGAALDAGEPAVDGARRR
jgi:multiple sugar transport system ATP-binding protein